MSTTKLVTTKQAITGTNAANTEGGVLSLLWRRVLIEKGFIEHVDVLIDKYVANAKNNPNSNVKVKNRHTIFSNVTADQMTFKTFLDLMFNFLHATNLELTVKVTYPNGDDSVHTVNISGAMGKEMVTDTNEEDKNDKV